MQSKVSVSIPKAALSELPVVTFPGEIIVIDTVEKVPEALDYLRQYKWWDLTPKPVLHFTKGVPTKLRLFRSPPTRGATCSASTKRGLLKI